MMSFLLRACIVNMHTTAADVDALVGLVVREGRALDAARRGVPPASRPSA